MGCISNLGDGREVIVSLYLVDILNIPNFMCFHKPSKIGIFLLQEKIRIIE